MSEKPNFVVAAERQAAIFGVTPQDILDADVALLESSPYPAPECLQPQEIDAIVRDQDSTTGAQLAHLSECEYCAPLVETLSSIGTWDDKAFARDLRDIAALSERVPITQWENSLADARYVAGALASRLSAVDTLAAAVEMAAWARTKTRWYEKLFRLVRGRRTMIDSELVYAQASESLAFALRVDKGLREHSVHLRPLYAFLESSTRNEESLNELREALRETSDPVTSRHAEVKTAMHHA